MFIQHRPAFPAKSQFGNMTSSYIPTGFEAGKLRHGYESYQILRSTD